MRLLAFVVTSGLVLTSGVNLLFAQHSGGHSSGGHSSAGSHSSSAGVSHGVYPTQPTPLGLQHYYSNGVTGIAPGALPTSPLSTSASHRGPVRIGAGHSYAGEGRRNYPAYGYAYVPYFDPFYDYNSGFYFNGPDQDYGYGQVDPATQTATTTANLMGEQIDRLSAEVDDLKNQQAQGSAPTISQQPRYYAPPMLPPQDDPPAAPITLVLKDGKQVEINSFAVMGDQIWDFSSHPTRKIEISSINMEASRKATEAGGAEFPDFR